jgi:hypothetical protein
VVVDAMFPELEKAMLIRCRLNRSKIKLFLLSYYYYYNKVVSWLQDTFNASSDYSRPMPAPEEMQGGRPNHNQQQICESNEYFLPERVKVTRPIQIEKGMYIGGKGRIVRFEYLYASQRK